MNRDQYFAVGAIVLFVVLIGSVFAAGVAHTLRQSSSMAVSNADDAAVRATVEGLGQSLRQISLLAPDAGAQLARSYAPYVAPELLSQWKADPSQAVGRQTSSPWPERIDVVSVSPAGTDTYTVEGNVLEVTSGSGGFTPAAIYPISLTVKKIGGQWLITALTKGAYSALPQPSTLTGTWECLPHKDTTGPQTTECALGIKADTGGNYAVDSSLMSRYPIDYATGTKVRITGTITPVEALSSIQKYDIKGIIRATSIEAL